MEEQKPLKDFSSLRGEEEPKDPSTQEELSVSPEEIADMLSRNMSHKVTERIEAGRNSPCPCGSGSKFKNCCWDARHG
jgi:uncharacterized protein YecA (UPF0149 family)